MGTFAVEFKSWNETHNNINAQKATFQNKCKTDLKAMNTISQSCIFTSYSIIESYKPVNHIYSVAMRVKLEPRGGANFSFEDRI